MLKPRAEISTPARSIRPTCARCGDPWSPRTPRLLGTRAHRCDTGCHLLNPRATTRGPARALSPRQVVREEATLLSHKDPARPTTLHREDPVGATHLSRQGPLRLILLQREGQAELTAPKSESQVDPLIHCQRSRIDHTLTPLRPDRQQPASHLMPSLQAAVAPLSTTTDADRPLDRVFCAFCERDHVGGLP